MISYTFLDLKIQFLDTAPNPTRRRKSGHGGLDLGLFASSSSGSGSGSVLTDSCHYAPGPWVWGRFGPLQVWTLSSIPFTWAQCPLTSTLFSPSSPSKTLSTCYFTINRVSSHLQIRLFSSSFRYCRMLFSQLFTLLALDVTVCLSQKIAHISDLSMAPCPHVNVNVDLSKIHQCQDQSAFSAKLDSKSKSRAHPLLTTSS